MGQTGGEVIGEVKFRAQAAVRHRDLAWVMKHVPSAHRDNPAVISKLLATAASADPTLAASAAYHAAHAALADLQAVSELQNKIAAVYHDPALRAEIGEARLAQAWANPSAAYEELIQRSAADRLSPALDAALNTLGEVREYTRRTNGGDLPKQAAAPLPNDAGGRDREIAVLLGKSVAGTISKAEDDRLNQLYETRVAQAEEAAPARDAAGRFAVKPPSAEYARLIEQSITDKLTPAEDARLNDLSEGRAIELGFAEPQDFATGTED